MALGAEVRVGRGAAMDRRHRPMSRLLEIIRCRLGIRWTTTSKQRKDDPEKVANIFEKVGKTGMAGI